MLAFHVVARSLNETSLCCVVEIVGSSMAMMIPVASSPSYRDPARGWKALVRPLTWSIGTEAVE